MISNTTLTKFNQRIAELADEPALTPDELKARFDACPEELRVGHNALVGSLLAPTAAAELGFAKTPGVPADSVQAAVTSVQKQLTDIALGTVPEGSIGRSKLTGALAEELDGMQEKIEAHTQMDTDLQSQIHTKAEIVIGTYGGNNADSRLVSLGFKPKAILVTDKRGVMMEANVTYFGGFSTAAQSSPAITIGDDGFTIYNRSTSKLYTNHVDFSPYNYIAFK